MLEPPFSPNEERRLAALRALNILDTPAEERFDRITRVAQRIFEVPIALVSLIDANRQWFKSKQGLDASETPRNISFCGHAILGNDLFVVPDTQQDPRFEDNPLVTGDPKIRFYAGCPLTDPNGHSFGTLCLIDRQPRQLSARDRQILQDLADMVESELEAVELNKTVALLGIKSRELEEFLENANDLIQRVTPEGRFLFVNRAWREALGYSKDEVSPLVLRDVLHPDSLEDYMKMFNSVMAGEIVKNFETVLVTKSGRPLVMSVNSNCEMRDGTPYATRTFLRDITQIHEQANLLDLAHDTILVMDMDGTISFWNHGAEVMYGWTKEEAIGQKAQQLLQTVFPKTFTEIKADLMRFGFWEGEFLHTRRDGSRVIASIRHALQRDGYGRPVSILEINYDITEQKRAQEALVAANAKLKVVLDSATEVSIIATDPEGVIRVFNSGAERMLGYAAEEMIGKQTPKLIHLASEVEARGEEMSKEFGRPVQGFDVFVEYARQGGFEEREWTYVRKNGTHLTVNLVVTALQNEDGSIAGFLGIANDMTERKAIERMKDEFVSVVSHELRTPLTSIRGSLGLLAAGLVGTLPEKGKRMLEIAVTNTDRLIRLINDILDFERLESGKVPLEKRVCEAGELMTQATDVMRALGQKAGITLSVTPLPAQVWADSDRVLQTLTNLLSNAIKFSSSGGTVRLTATLRGDSVEFQIQDQGRGIPPEKLEEIFERFQQVDASDSREKGGTGLGLAICRSIVQQHGGRIWVQSKVREGSSFFFTLPRPTEAKLPETPSATGGPVVLVCDDDPDLLAVVQPLLERHGFQTLAVTSGTEAVTQAVAHKPAAIMLDLIMPQMNGWETMAALKEDESTRDIPIIVFSGLSAKDHAGQTAGISDWVQKPFDEHSLLQALDQAVFRPSQRPRVLLVEDDLDLAGVLIAMFQQHGVEILHAQTGHGAIGLLQRLIPDLIVLDLVLPEGNGFTVADWLKQHDQAKKVPVLVYSAKDLGGPERERLQGERTQFLTKGRISPAEFEQRVITMLKGLLPFKAQDRTGVP